MTAIRATVVDGKIVLDAPADWPDGTAVVVCPADQWAASGVPDDDRPETPEEIEADIRRWAALEPIFQTPEEQAEFDRVLAERKAIELAGQQAYLEHLRKQSA